MKKTLYCFSLLLLSVIAFTNAADAQISITALNSPHTQNFDGMGDTDFGLVDDITGPLFGFYAFRAVGNTSPNTVFADSGLEIFAGFRNYGTASTSERALGMLPGPATGNMRLGLRIANNSGGPISSLEISYTGEQWHDGGSGSPQTLAFAYRKDVNVNDLTTGTYTPVPALSFISPTVGVGPTALNGNSLANRTFRSSTIVVNLAAGQEIMLRWEQVDAAGGDHGLSIDDLTVTGRGGPTAAGVNVGGRVVDASGRGLGRVTVMLSGGGLSEPMRAVTNAFGNYTFADVPAGDVYVLSVRAKRYRFTDPVRVIDLADTLSGIDFYAQP